MQSALHLALVPRDKGPVFGNEVTGRRPHCAVPTLTLCPAARMPRAPRTLTPSKSGDYNGQFWAIPEVARGVHRCRCWDTNVTITIPAWTYGVLFVDARDSTGVKLGHLAPGAKCEQVEAP